MKASFDDLRDRNDLEFLKKQGFFAEFSDDSNDFVEDNWLVEKQLKYKLEKRQFSRLVEMILFSKGFTGLFRRQVKKRIFLKNYDALCDLEEAERKSALQNSYLLIKDDYKRILSSCSFNKRKLDDDEDPTNSDNKKVKFTE